MTSDEVPQHGSSVANQSPSGAGWHWHSTLATAEALEPSVLAIAETAIAVALYGWGAFHGYFIHLVVAAIVAPLLLLRTAWSTGWAISYLKWDKNIIQLAAERVDRFIDSSRFGGILTPFVIVVFVVFVFSSIQLVKMIAILKSFFKNPLCTIRSIPANWWRVVACTDMFHEPEPLPGYLLFRNRNENEVEYVSMDKFLAPVSGVKNLLQQKNDGFSDVIFKFVALLSVFPFIIFAMTYRLTLKGSSLLYVPLIWLLFLTRPEHVENKLHQIKEFALYKVQRVVALVVVGFVASKIVLAPLWAKISAAAAAFASDRFVQLFVAPLELPRWQIASAVNGILAWVVFFAADYAQQGREPSVPLSFAVRVIWATAFVLTLYTTSVLIYNAFTLQWDLVSIGERWFPWQR